MLPGSGKLCVPSEPGCPHTTSFCELATVFFKLRCTGSGLVGRENINILFCRVQHRYLVYLQTSVLPSRGLATGFGPQSGVSTASTCSCKKPKPGSKKSEPSVRWRQGRRGNQPGERHQCALGEGQRFPRCHLHSSPA